MNIADNIIKYNLRNVLFVCGTACGGKTTMSRMLAKKYDMPLYDFDEMYQQHRAIADPRYQPDTCYHGTNFHEQWMRPVEEAARWSINSLHEQTEMAFIDLMKLSENRRVVADVLFTPDFTPDTIDPRQIVFLTVDKSMIRESYFNRPEKRDFYEYVKAQPLGDVYFENIFQSLELTNDMEQDMMRATGFKIIERTPDSTPENTLSIIEQHFGLKE